MEHIDVPDPDALEGEALWAFKTARLNWACFCYRVLIGHYRRSRKTHREAACRLKLGQVILAKAYTMRNYGPGLHSERNRKLIALAGRYFKTAADCYDRTENPIGKAECIAGMAALAMEQSRSEYAKQLYMQAIRVFYRAKRVSQWVDCLVGLADVERRQGFCEEAFWSYKRAATHYERTDDYAGVGNCYMQLGDIKLERESVAEAHAYYKKASKYYIKARSRIGRMHVLHALGDVEFKLECFWEAAAHYSNALTLAKKNRMLYSVGLMHFKTGCCTWDKASKAFYFEQARQDWMQIGRDDLVRLWLDD